MMKRFALALCLLGLALPVAADSHSDAGLAEVRDLGLLNGQALACSYKPAATRIKAVMIEHAPKSRRYGEVFESATNEAFLAQVKKDPAVCPDESALTSKAEDLTARLRAAVPAPASQ
ncbi:MAG: hypothetical protein WC029_11775 [Sulfuricella sp.]